MSRLRNISALFLAIVAVIFPATGAIAASVAVFADAAFVGVGPSIGDEASNVMFSLTSLGHTVNPINDEDSGAFGAALAVSDILLMPDNCQFCDSFLDLSVFTKSVITDFVADGGGFLINGTVSSRATDFLNDLFGFSLSGGSTGSTSGSFLDTVGAASTAFAGGPGLIAANDAATGILTTTLPTDAARIYTGSGHSDVALLPFGNGKVIYLGWDWFNSAPRFVGGQDGGWNDVLDLAVQEAATPIPEPSTAFLFALGLVGLAAGHRRFRLFTP